jgi:formate C-acetyltransferase
MAIHPRNQRYKDRVLAAPYEICIERARYYTESYKLTEGLHPATRAALAFEHTLKRMSVYVLDEERILGNRSSKLVGTVLPVERGDMNTLLELELDFLRTRESQPYRISDADARELRQTILPYWRGKTLRDRKKKLWKDNGLYFRAAVRAGHYLRMPKEFDLARLLALSKVPKVRLSYALKGLEELAYNNPAFVTNVFDVQGHLILGHVNVLQAGFAGVKAQAKKKLATLSKDDADGRAFLDAVIVSCNAIHDFAGRLADEAERVAADGVNEARRRDLLEAAAICRRVPYHPPRTFREAIQALWLTEVGGMIGYGMTAIFAIGRFDQYLYPYYARDLRAGRITPDEAVELLEELLIKLAYCVIMLPLAGKRTGSELGADSASPTVGGVDARGRNAVNELSHLVLDAFGNVKALGNSFTIRLSRKTPTDFWRKALATYRRTSGAALFNDDVAVPALQGCGYAPADARNYGVIGCVEPTGDGDTFACTSGNDLSLVAALEMALLDGRLRIMGKRIGPATGDPRAFKTFDELLDAFKKQTCFLIDLVAKAVNLKDQAYGEAFPNPYVSATLAGCVENARDMTQGGAKYNFASLGARGFGTTVDSLAAIKRYVFETGAISMGHLLALLDNNFAGGEIVRATLLNKAPKYGCDDDYADAIATDVAEFFCREVAQRRSIRGGPFRPGFFSYGMHVLDGMVLGASPSGRRAGEPVSNSFSPANGSERRGPTAMLRSIAKIDHRLISNGCAVNIKLLPSLFADDERLDKMVALVKGFFAQGGLELQPNVVSNRVLREAQAHPENYRDLVVRVSGYSAMFTDIGKTLQDEIISRTEFGAT